MAHEKPIEHHPRIKPLSYGVFLPPFAEFAEPRRMVALAQSAEQAGWDGLYLWDHMLTIPGMAVADSFVMAAAIAQATERIRLGMMVTPLPRRRPWVFARQAATLDQLSEGRLDVRCRPRPRRMAGVQLLLWRGRRSGGEGLLPRRLTRDPQEGLVGRAGPVRGRAPLGESAAFLPRPVQQPLPVWVACRWPHHRPLARAATPPGLLPAV